MHMHCSRSASCHPPLTPRSRGRQGSGLFHSSVHCRDGQLSRSQHSCRWTWVPGAWCTRWLEGDGGPGPRRRTRRNFSWNSEMAGRSRNLFCWAPVGLAVLKPAQGRRATSVSLFPWPHFLHCPGTPPSLGGKATHATQAFTRMARPQILPATDCLSFKKLVPATHSRSPFLRNNYCGKIFITWHLPF